MSHLLTAPTAVVVVGEGEPADTARSRLADAAVSDVFHDPTGDELTDRDDVGCLVVTGDGSAPLDHAERFGTDDPLRPVVAYLDTDDASLVARLSQTDAGVVLADEPPDRLREQVERRIDRYRERRWWRAESGMFQTLLDGIDGAIYAKDDAGRHLCKSSSPGDPSPETFFGKTDVDVYGDSEATRSTLADDLKVVETGEPVRGREQSFEAADGTRWSRTTKLPWREDGNVVGLVGYTRDVTEEVRNRTRLRQQEAQFEQFARSIQHDVSNPLQVASSSIALARERGSTEDLERANRALERAEEVLMDLTTAETLRDHGVDSDEPWQPEGIPMHDLLSDVWDVIDTGEASLRIAFDEDATINEPAESVRPVIENLLKNAIQHGGDTVTVRVGPTANGFYVEDDGPGIPAEERDTVFEDGYTTAESGSGTGLTIVSETAARRDWSLTVTESQSGGARIEVDNVLSVWEPPADVTVGEELSLTADFDVGDVAVPGDSRYDDEHDEWAVFGSGQNVYADINEFHCRGTAVAGPVQIEGRVTGVEHVNEWSAGGLMVRAGRDTSATYGAICRSAGHGTGLLWRTTPGTPGTGRQLEEDTTSQPRYRIRRVGDTVTIAYKFEDEAWQTVDQRRVALDEDVVVGLFMCSVEPDQLGSATFDTVSVNRLRPE